MTIRDLLNKINKEKPNSFAEADLIAFVNEVEAEVAEQLGETEVPVYKYEHDLEFDKVLLAPAPYDLLYVSYVKMQMDAQTEEWDSYYNDQAQHNQDFRDFTDWVVRTGQKKRSIYPRRFKNVTRW